METERSTYIDKGVTVKYEFVRNCEDFCPDGICRCGRIESARVSKVDVARISSFLYYKIFDGGKKTRRNGLINQILYGSDRELDMHCIDRVLRANRIWLPEAWCIEVIDGYYGQELGNVEICQPTREKIDREIEEVIGMYHLSDKVESLLRLEYGRVLPELEGKRYVIRRIAVADIIKGSLGHSNLVSVKNCDYYSDLNFSGIRCLVSEKGDGKYRLIDGYHRISATVKDTVSAIVAV